jgi:hypothetical protein
MRLHRRRFVAAAALTGVAGCLGGSGPDVADDGGGQAPGGESTLPTADRRLPMPAAPDQLRSAVQSGGPPKDGIPSIDDPTFLTAGEATFLDPGDPVFGVVRNGVAKAYPQKILVWHEVVNDVIAGDPVCVTYCPLTGTVLGFERGDVTFGVSGRLLNSNLIMFDRATETWWPQVLATALPGPWNETPEVRSLREFRLVWTTWGQWREHNPDTVVLGARTGHVKNYNRDPYGAYNPRDGYYEGGPPAYPALHADDRFRDKTVVMGARDPEGAVAFPKSALEEKRLLRGRLGDAPVLAVYDRRYDTAYVYRDPDGSGYAVEDGSVVGPDGEYEPDGLPLSRVHTFDAMWFAWVGFYPETNVYE